MNARMLGGRDASRVCRLIFVIATQKRLHNSEDLTRVPDTFFRVFIKIGLPRG
jgi:hypothetical protein